MDFTVVFTFSLFLRPRKAAAPTITRKSSSGEMVIKMPVKAEVRKSASGEMTVKMPAKFSTRQ